jgi:hypothetical protein
MFRSLREAGDDCISKEEKDRINKKLTDLYAMRKDEIDSISKKQKAFHEEMELSKKKISDFVEEWKAKH